jgi:hypothetical protein
MTTPSSNTLLSRAERKLRREAARKWELSRRDAARWVLLERVKVNASKDRSSVTMAALAEEAMARQSDLSTLCARVKACDGALASLSHDWRCKLPFLQHHRSFVRATASQSKHQRRLDAYRREIDEFCSDRRLQSLDRIGVAAEAAPPQRARTADYPVLTDVIVFAAAAPA